MILNGEPLPVELSEQEFDLLYKLWEADGNICHRRDLCELFWSDGKAYGNLYRLVARLRAKLGESGVDPAIIRPVPRIGYRLTM